VGGLTGPGLIARPGKGDFPGLILTKEVGYKVPTTVLLSVRGVLLVDTLLLVDAGSVATLDLSLHARRSTGTLTKEWSGQVLCRIDKERVSTCADTEANAREKCLHSTTAEQQGESRQSGCMKQSH
jgi:hypothetical protein